MSGVSSVVWDLDPAELVLNRPVVVIAFEGWFDAAMTATAAIDHLAATTNASEIARIPCEEYADFRVHRPQAMLDEHGVRRIVWPDTKVRWAASNGETRDLFLISGAEPDYRWRHFVDDVLSVAAAVRAELMITLGASAGRAPHTRAPIITASAATVELTHALGLSLPRYQGITGVVGVLQQTLGKQGRDAISLRVDVPYYLGGAGFPPGSAALLERVGQLLDTPTGHVAFGPRIAEWHTGIADAIAEHDELPGQIAFLETAYDRAQAPDAGSLVADLERYLNARREDG